MKNLMDIELSSAQLQVLIGFKFDLNKILVDRGEGEMCRKGLKLPIREIVQSRLIPKTRSSDERFDNQNRVLQAVEHIQAKGLPRSLVDKIMKQPSCVKNSRIVGQLSFLNHIISEQEKTKINKRLNQAFNYFKMYGELP